MVVETQHLTAKGNEEEGEKYNLVSTFGHHRPCTSIVR
jgi:hypothetical protein